MKVLIVEDEKAKRITLSVDLSQAGYDVSAVENAHDAFDFLEREFIDVVIADLRLPGIDGLELLRLIKKEVSPATEVIIITGYGSIPLAVESMRDGALDFVAKPFDNLHIIPLLKNIEKKKNSKAPNLRLKPFVGVGSTPEYSEIDQAIVGRSPQMRRLKRLILTCAGSDVNMLLSGETGTGKDLIASVVHKHSKRSSLPFVKVSCSVFSEETIESEIFGCEQGPFSGSDHRKTGRIELTEQGTLYLDDVDHLPPKVQIKLLRVIEEKVFERVGSATAVNCDVRIIASTKVNLAEKIAQGLFREDLYYRLKVCGNHIPPLRERIEDIPLLAAHLIERISKGRQVEIPGEVIHRLENHHWPGNVRELAYMLERAYIIGQGVLTVDRLDFDGEDRSSTEFQVDMKSIVRRTEKDLLETALKKAGGNKNLAARSLGIKPSTFRDKLTKYGLA